MEKTSRFATSEMRCLRSRTSIPTMIFGLGPRSDFHVELDDGLIQIVKGDGMYDQDDG